MVWAFLFVESRIKPFLSHVRPPWKTLKIPCNSATCASKVIISPKLCLEISKPISMDDNRPSVVLFHGYFLVIRYFLKDALKLGGFRWLKVLVCEMRVSKMQSNKPVKNLNRIYDVFKDPLSSRTYIIPMRMIFEYSIPTIAINPFETHGPII